MSDGAVKVFLGLGSNLGDRLAELQAGLDALDAHPGVSVEAASGIWETAYVGPGEDQPAYLNACLAVRTTLDPGDLLAFLKTVETGRGRAADGHMKPRPLDLDILLNGDAVVDRPELRVPHPRLGERAFVLEPLAELAPGLRPPDSRETVAGLCEKIRGAAGQEIRRWSDGGLRLPAPDRP